MTKRILLFATLLLSLRAAPSPALARFDFEQMYFFETGYRIKDHCHVKIDSLYHLYYIRAPLLPVGPQYEDSLGHAVSTDLIHWTILEPVVSVVPGTWEEEAVWAPHVITGPDGKYYMFYTGVNSRIAQAIGLATSTDGFTWTKSPQNPVYLPDTTWARWDENISSDCRDPFVFFENGLYYMLTTTMSRSGRATIACATSPDLLTWTDKGPIYSHQDPQSTNPLESPFLIKKSGKYHLFFSEYLVAGTSYFSSDSLFSGWDLSDRVIVDLGGGAEVLDISGTELFSRYIAFPVEETYWYTIKVDTLVWNDGLPEVQIPPPLQKDWLTVYWNGPLAQPTFGDNTYIRAGVLSGLQGNCWVGTYEKYQGPLQPFPGLAGDFQGDNLIGELRSTEFVLGGSAINLLVGGGNKPDSAYVALCDACDDREIFSETGSNSETMEPRIWSIGETKGRKAYVKIVDRSTTAFGHINVDNIVESGQGSGVPDYPYVVVLEPNGGEVWDEQTQHPIKWRAHRSNLMAVDSVSVFFSMDSGKTYIPVANGIQGDSSYLWTVPGTPSDFCRIRVTAYGGSSFGWCDQSDTDFIARDKTPPQVSLVRPGEGDTLSAGSATVISWITTDNGTIDSISIYLSFDDGRTYPDTIVEGFRYGAPIHGSTSEYLWTVPYSYQSDSCRVSIHAFDHGANEGVGVSGLFKIVRPVGIDGGATNSRRFPFSLSVAPNPFRAATEVILFLPSGGNARVDVFSVTGAMVRTLFSGRGRPGSNNFVWDGKDRNGNVLPSGVYLIRAKTEKNAVTRKIVLLR